MNDEKFFEDFGNILEKCHNRNDIFCGALCGIPCILVLSTGKCPNEDIIKLLANINEIKI